MLLPLCLRELGEGTIEGGVVRHTGQLQGLAHLVGGREPLLKVAVGAVAIDFEHHAGDALGEGVVVSALGLGVGGECLLGDVVSEFCDTDQSALSDWCIPPQGLFHIATPLCNRAIPKHTTRPAFSERYITFFGTGMACPPVNRTQVTDTAPVLSSLLFPTRPKLSWSGRQVCLCC